MTYPTPIRLTACVLLSLILVSCSSSGPGKQAEEPLTGLSDQPDLYDWRPTWSPDGAKIAFASERDGNYEIYVMNAADAKPTRLTADPEDDWRPKWSPDDTKIAFASERDGNWEIYVMDADGQNPVRLTDHPAREERMTWSPDGSQMAFDSDREGHFEVYVMDADGSNPVRLTTREGFDVMNADGSNPTKRSNTGVSAFIDLARQQGVDEAIRRYQIAKAALPEEDFFVEAEVDLLAYELLDAGDEEEALKLFILNTEVFPDAENVFLSLGDVQMQLENKAQAIAAYEKALALNPDRAATLDQLLQARAD